MKQTNKFFFCFIVLLLAFLTITRAEQENLDQGKQETVSPPSLFEIKAFSERKVFVGNEPVVINFAILFKTGISYDENVFNYLDLSPFKVISASIGNRVAIPQVKDLEMVRARILINLSKDQPYGTFFVPAVRIVYEFDEIIPDKDGKMARVRRKKSALSNGVWLEKVPIYVETDTLHEVVRIGDVSANSLIIHIGKEVEILNEFLPEKPKAGVKYLSTFSFEKPLTSLSVQRENNETDEYKIIRYNYIFSILDIQSGPYSVPFPAVLWRGKNQKISEVMVISPKPALIEVRSILKKDTTFEPQKDVRPDISRERTIFFLFPLIAAVLIIGSLLLWLLYELVRFLRSQRIRHQIKTQLPEEKPADLKVVYETSWLSRLKLKMAVNRALAKYNNQPNEENCIQLRNLLARYIVSCRKRGERISRFTACSMTAEELAVRASHKMKKFIDFLKIVDQCLETTIYETIGRKE